MEEEKNETLEPSNEIVEINSETGEIHTLEDVETKEPIDNKKKKKKKAKKHSFWNRLNKKQKITVIIVLSVIFLLFVGIIVYFVVFRDNKSSKDKEPVVIVEKDNYRYENGRLVFLNDKDKEIGSYDCKNKNEKLCYIANYSNEDNFDVETYVDENDQRIDKLSKIYNNRYVFINDNAKEGNLILYDIKQKKELDEYKLIKEDKDNYVIVVDKEGKYGVINLFNEVENSVDFKYNYLGYIAASNGLVAKIDEGSLLINNSGEELSKVIKGDIRLFNDKYISVVVDEKYYLYNYNGIVSLSKDIDYISFYNEYVITIKNKKLNIYDKDLNILNIEPILLSNKYYNPVITVDKNYKEVNSKEAYSVVLNGDNLSVEVDNEYILVNIYTGKVNKNYGYISYSNNSLYVYSDLEKNNLLGSYSCSNFNTVTSSTTSYDACTLASETELLNRGLDTKDIGMLPVYNNRFIFIKDGDFIVLLDLKESAKKAAYTEVDAGYYAKDFSFVASEGTLVMAKNTNGNYGILKIDSANVTGVIAFKDNDNGGSTTAIKFLDNNFLVTRSDGKYYLYKDTGGKKPIAISTEEILEYNSKALKVKGSNSTYAINTLDGKVIFGNLLFAEMHDEFFVGITSDKKINVYKYEINTKGLITENIPALTTTDYKNCFKIVNNSLVVGGNSYSFSVSGE